MPESVGSVSVDVVPSAERFSKELAAQLSPQIKRIAKRFGDILSSNAAEGIRKGLAEGLAGTESAAKKAGDRSGASFGGEFARTARTRIEAALRSLPDAQIGVASSAAEQKLKDLRAQLATLSGKNVGVDIGAADALAQVAEIQAGLAALGAESPNIEVKVDTAGAVAQLAAFRAAVGALTGEEGGSGGGGGGLARIRSLAAGAGSGLASMTSSLGATAIAAIVLIPVVITLGVALAGVTAALAAPLGAAAGGLTLFGVLAGFAVKNVMATSKQIDALKKKADGLKAGAQRDAVLAELKTLEASLSASQRGFLKARQGLSKAFGTLTKGKAGDALLAPLTSGLNLLSKILPKVEPLISAVSVALTGLLDGLAKKAGGSGFEAFISWMAALAGPAIKSVASIIGSIGRGFLALFAAASGTGVSALDGIANAMKRFADYLNSTQGQAKLQQFFQWLRDNGPGILSAIGDIGKLIGQIIEVSMKIGPTLLAGMGLFAKYLGVASPPLVLFGDNVMKLGGIFRSVYNVMIGPALAAIIGSIAVMMRVWSALLGTLGRVPGFGWAKDASKAMRAAADDALGLANDVRRIPSKVKITVSANFQAMYDQINRMNAAIGKSGGRAIHYTTGYGGGQTAYARGTTYAKGGPTLVGELGPELVYLRDGSKVLPADKTANLMQPQTAGVQRMVITNYDVMTGYLELIAEDQISQQSAHAGVLARMGG